MDADFQGNIVLNSKARLFTLLKTNYHRSIHLCFGLG